MKKIRELVKDIDSKVSILDKEGEYLYKLAKKNNVGIVVEIGSWLGRSTIWLAKGSSNSVWAIDPHRLSKTHQREGEENTLESFKKNIKEAGVEEIVVPLVMTSKEALREIPEVEIGLLFIDASHDYEDVKFDFEEWTKYLAIGGVVALHDTIAYEGPRRIVEEKIVSSTKYRIIGVVGQILAARKVKPSFFNFWWNYYWYMSWWCYSKLFMLAKKLPKGIKEWMK